MTADFFFSGKLDEPQSIEYYLPEAALYEDMCSAYNLAVDLEGTIPAESASKNQTKTCKMAQRTAVLAAFYFVEAYLNAIAFDFCSLEDRRRKLPRDQLALLLEVDSEKKRERCASFREKALQYPKIILGLRKPVLSEDNCAELRLLLGRAKEIRDSIVHQSPKIQSKVKAMVQLGTKDVADVVDAAVGFVSQLNQRLGRLGQDLRWIYPRVNSGRFPESAFE